MTASRRRTKKLPTLRTSVPDRILVAFFAELRLYGFRPDWRLFAELLRILEEDDAAAWREVCRAKLCRTEFWSHFLPN